LGPNFFAARKNPLGKGIELKCSNALDAPLTQMPSALLTLARLVLQLTLTRRLSARLPNTEVTAQSRFLLIVLFAVSKACCTARADHCRVSPLLPLQDEILHVVHN